MTTKHEHEHELPIWPRPRPNTSNVNLPEDTKFFIYCWLNPAIESFSLDAWAVLCHATATAGLDWLLIQRMILDYTLPVGPDGAEARPDGIRRLDTPEYRGWFLRTLYWRVTAAEVRRLDKRRCRRCARSDSLEVHHTSYANHGAEHLHLDDLETLCAVCHYIEHGATIQAVLAEREDAPSSGDCAHLVLMYQRGFRVRGGVDLRESKAFKEANAWRTADAWPWD